MRIPLAIIAIACFATATAGDPPAPVAPPAAQAARSITMELYDSFQRAELARWDAIIAPDVVLDSSGAWGVHGLDTLKGWAAAFTAGLATRIDLVDEHLALDAAGNGRGFITFNLHWKHRAEFFGIKPTGREGTSVETLILTIRGNRITRMGVADNTLDLALYLWDRGWPMPHNIVPPVLVTGVQRR
jgi:hypothetical protein